MQKEAFVIKYDMHGQRHLAAHLDGCEFSYIVALNDSFTGGGTYFEAIGRTVRLKPGEMVVFDAKSRHSGVPIESGTRYILTGFLSYKHHDFCDTDDDDGSGRGLNDLVNDVQKYEQGLRGGH